MNDKPIKHVKILDNLVGTLSAAPDFETEEELEPESQPEPEPRYKRSPKKYIMFATVLIILAVIGAVNTVTFFKDTGTDILNKKALNSELTTFIYPVVLTDPVGFDSIDNLQMTTVISSAIWRIILTENTEKYVKESDSMIISALDAERSAREIFGPGFVVAHRTVGDIEWSFVYDEASNSYRVPQSTRFMTYAPVIRDMRDVNGVYELTVDYVVPVPEIEGISYTNTPVKTLIYKVSHGKSGKMIKAIEFNASLNANK